ncbi:uncharacterized protein PHALS_14676 [Plasmopara halstedii]|uniref:Uncharacterized protein n=1 Tax=Plasmopara halstedii TaxID=4781 RepID=A0A0P1ANN7_PLAHL|nr:uncharacterized protein PHALS_14676 [Plasmopara halstedii]CEG42997.1 hypothetical protein PHALS_14676 [Plasmopara halstedii]|eukprot:XP_024579366.1 hypothetical protein PHALS_14676 [Plasmopara halstedii]
MPATKELTDMKSIRNEKLGALRNDFQYLIKAFGDIITGKEAKRLHFILPVLASVCALFDEDVLILPKKRLLGNVFMEMKPLSSCLRDERNVFVLCRLNEMTFSRGFAQTKM